MKLSLSWLKEHIDLSGHTAEEIATLLTFAGVEVESIEHCGVDIPQVVVAQIESSTPHPDADRLNVCQVNDGTEIRQIVCGAKNYVVGDKVPLAQPGAVLPGNFKIKKSKLRGVVSEGMLCSGKELGLSQDHEGLFLLDAEAEVGKPLSALFEKDTVFDLEITPNRPDLLSHYGIARELSTLLDQDLLSPREEVSATVKTDLHNDIQLESTHACPYYTARIIRGITVQESPPWLKQKLETIGLRPINNIVDITNYILFEWGHPLHAFDLDRIEGNLCIRQAKEKESFLALNEETYSLSPQDVVISDDKKILALGGIIGGKDSGVTADTKNILLESAYFTPGKIRSSARRLTITTDSSYRFERGTNPHQISHTSEAATSLILKLAGGTAEEKLLLQGSLPQHRERISFDKEKSDQLLGISIPQEKVARIFHRLGLNKEGELWRIPHHRSDLQRHIDLVEEVARIYGIDNIPSRHQSIYHTLSLPDTRYDRQIRLKRSLVSRGFYEAQNIKFLSEKQLNYNLHHGQAPRLKNPLSQDYAYLRPSLLPLLLETMAKNARLGLKTLPFFEMGTLFQEEKKRIKETLSLALMLSGKKEPPHWQHQASTYTFFDLKGIVETLLMGKTIVFLPIEDEAFLIAAEMQYRQKSLGTIGQIHPRTTRKLDFDLPVYTAEINLQFLFDQPQEQKKFIELQKFPAITRDVSLEIPQDMPHAEIENFFLHAKQPLLENITLFDLFTDETGEKLARDKKSLAYSLTYRDKHSTLKAEKVDAVHEELLEKLKRSLPVQIR